jgi:hypothetical protein
MSRHPYAAERLDQAREDHVRREAYERALERVRGRVGLCESISDEQLNELREYTGPEIAGRSDDVRRRGRN